MNGIDAGALMQKEMHKNCSVLEGELQATDARLNEAQLLDAARLLDAAIDDIHQSAFPTTGTSQECVVRGERGGHDQCVQGSSWTISSRVRTGVYMIPTRREMTYWVTQVLGTTRINTSQMMDQHPISMSSTLRVEIWIRRIGHFATQQMHLQKIMMYTLNKF